MTSFYISPDVAVLPGKEAAVLYQGKTGRSFRVSFDVGNQLTAGAVRADAGVPHVAIAQLVDIGVLQTVPVWSVNRLTPFGRSAAALFGGLVILGTGTWGWLWVRGLLPQAWPNVSGWVWLLPAFLLTTLLHEWGHVLALRSMKGRTGRILLRLGWPWALVEVGPYRRSLSPTRCTVLLAGGTALELTVLGIALTGLSFHPNHPFLSALVWASTVHLGFDLFPTPWSDTGQLLGLWLQHLRTKGRGASARSS